jgi:hypothetical protein
MTSHEHVLVVGRDRDERSYGRLIFPEDLPLLRCQDASRRHEHAVAVQSKPYA